MTNLEYEKKYETLVKNKVLELYKDTSAKIFLFGSRARGDYRRGSDFDIGIESVDHDTFCKLRTRFEDFWEDSIIPYKVEFVFFETANPDFKKEAKRDIVIWKND